VEVGDINMCSGSEPLFFSTHAGCPVGGHWEVCVDN
jgi:hypothetical protein